MLQQIGVDAADVLYSNPIKPPSHIAAAHRAGLWRFSFDSEGELYKLAQHAPGSAPRDDPLRRAIAAVEAAGAGLAALLPIGAARQAARGSTRRRGRPVRCLPAPHAGQYPPCPGA